VVQYGSRLLEHQGRLSTRFLDIADLVTEASYWGEKAGSDCVVAEHVQRAISERDFRSSQVRDKLQRAIKEGLIKIGTEGRVVGQVNGLSVLQASGYTFGVPSRISARVAPGQSGVVDIERETAMSGRIHSKGVLVLAGYLAGKYAQDMPLGLAASLTFEQMYNDVDGDSASGAELCCLLSALSCVPLDQGIAVTGSVDQNGDVQAVGGVQYKIEGFFDICRAKGLTANQGVVIPASNVSHLMLRSDVVDAVRQGQFHIYAVTHIDEVLELLTGAEAGVLQADDSFPTGSVNQRVRDRLRYFAERLSMFASGKMAHSRNGHTGRAVAIGEGGAA